MTHDEMIAVIQAHKEKKQIAGELNGHTVCTATHPNMPNHSGHSRGRKIHLLKTLEKTFCNMKVDELAPADYRFYSTTSNGTCKSCINAAARQTNKQQGLNQ